MRTHSIRPSFASVPAVVAGLLAAPLPSLAWKATGTVRSTTGAALSGVAVSVKDATSPTATTDAQGAFDIGVATGVQLRAPQASAWRVRASGRHLDIRSPLDGPLALSLVDGSGRRLWTGSAVSRDGAAEADVALSLPATAAWLLVSHAEGSWSQAVVTGVDGLRVAPHLASARAQASSLPVLVFRKDGYADTTRAMAAETETGLAVAMRSTATTVVCPSTKLSAGDQNKTITVKGVSRKYILHVPSTYKGDTPVPLLVDYHPIGGSASGQSSGTQYKAQADKDGAISVYPDGLQSPNMGQAWNVKGCCTTADDTAFARALVAEVKTLACIDPKRVYAAGFSMGGGMTHFTACHLADVFAAAAPAAFDLLKENVDICKPARPITMVMFRGTSDGVVNYAGGYSAVVSGMAINFLGAKATFAKWAELDKCTGSPSAEDANGCSTYSNCADGVQVTLCTKQGGGHDQGNGSVGWPILKKYTLP